MKRALEEYQSITLLKKNPSIQIWIWSKKKVYKAIITLISISASINWYGLPRGAVQSPPLKIFKTQPDKNPEQPAHIHPCFTVAIEGGHGTK